MKAPKNAIRSPTSCSLWAFVPMNSAGDRSTRLPSLLPLSTSITPMLSTGGQCSGQGTRGGVGGFGGHNGDGGDGG